MPVTDRMYSNTLAPVVLTIIVIVLGYYSVNEYNESAQVCDAHFLNVLANAGYLILRAKY